MGVTHAVRGRFGPSSASLGVVFARKNSLDIYVVRAGLHVAHLELLQSTRIGANILSLCTLRRTSPTGDLLLLAFEGVRVALMAWQHDARAWVTEQTLDLAKLLGAKLCSPSSITRSLDPEDYARPLLRGMAGHVGDTLIKADPSGRCFAVLNRKQSAFYVIPIHADDDASRPGGRVVNESDIFLIDLPTEYEATNVKDFAFLHGSFEPNMVILHESKRTWSGRAAIQRNTCSLLSLAIDIRSKRHSKTWNMESLPYDSEKIEPIPESAGGGALLVSTSVLMQVRHGACVTGLSLNCFGDAYATEMNGKYDALTQSDTLVECDASHCRFLDFEENLPDTSSGTQCIALLSLKGGELYFLNLAVGPWSKLSMKRAGSTVIASEIVPVNNRFFVLASRLSDSLLIEYQKTMEEGGCTDQDLKPNVKQKGEGATASKTKSNKKKKRVRSAEEEAEYEMIYGTKPPQDSSDEDSDDEAGTKQRALELKEKDEGTRGVYDDEDELGWVFNSGQENETSSGKDGGAGSWALKVKDTITCFGPGADIAVGCSPDDATSSKLDMVIAGGYAKNGCLAVVHQSIRPRTLLEFNVQDCNGIWTLHDPSVARRERADRKQRNAEASARNTGRRARNTKMLAARKRFVDESLTEFRKERQEEADAVAKKIADAKKEDEASSVHEKPLEEHASVDDAKLSTLKKSENENDSPTTEVLNGTETNANGTSIATKEDGPPRKKIKSEDGSASPVKDPVDTENGIINDISDEIKMQMEHQAEASFPLEAEETPEEDITDEDALHSYMLLSSSKATTILKTGLDLIEVGTGAADFSTEERTITAGNVLGTHAIVQVLPSRLKVLKNGSSECEHVMPSPDIFIKHAQVSDPFVLVQTNDGAVSVLRISGEEFDEAADDRPDQSASAVEQDDLFVFDEYGNVLQGKENGDGNENHATVPSDAKAPGKGSKEESRVGFRNISISVDFTAPGSEAENTSIVTAVLYKGGLASEVASDGILSRDSNNEEVPKASAKTEPKAEDTQEDPSELESSAPVTNATADDAEEKGQVDDEDRMLYGDEDEEDLMLYGSAPKDEGDLKGDASGAPAKTSGAVDKDREGSTEKMANGSTGLDGKQSSAAIQEKGVMPMPTQTVEASIADHLLVISKANGTLQVISPALEWQEVLECPAFFAAPSIIRDAPMSEEDKRSEDIPFASPNLQIKKLGMLELSGSALLAGLSTPVLIAMPEAGIPLIYRAFLTSKSAHAPSARSRLAFHRILFKDRGAALLAKSMTCASKKSGSPETGSEGSLFNHIPLVHFRNIAGRSGVFIGGPCPLLLFAERGYPRIHAFNYSNTFVEVEGDQGIVGFTEFHNVKCPRGFVSVGQDGLVRIGSLPTPSLMNYDSPTPMRKISLRCTPHKVAYHAGSATYGVLASMPTLTSREERLARILQSLEKHDKRHYQHTAAQAEAETGDDRSNRVPHLFEELHELRVYRPDTWELIKSHKLQKGEVGLAIANMTVDVYKAKTAASGVDIPSSKKGDDGNESAFASSLKMRPKNMLVVGTGHLNGEDASSRGRLLMFEISKISRQEVYPEGGGGTYTAFQLQLIAEKELFSPVTAVASMEGYVIAGVGPQVSVYKLVGDEIIHLSFAFGQLYCSSLSSIKQYVVAADMCKSVSFMYFRDRNNSVSFLGKDYEHVTSLATEFLIENDNMSIVVSDGMGNLQLMNYAHASVAESRGGKRLLINGGTQFGSRINKFVRVRAPDSRQSMQSGAAVIRAGAHALLFTTLDGGVGALVSVTEEQFGKLRELRGQVLAHPGIVRHAGVNPAEQTAFRPESASTVLLEQRLLDSRALFDVFGVTTVEMSMIARKAKMNLVGLAQTVVDLDNVIARF